MDKLETMLRRARATEAAVLVVVDGVFSMEGDVCDLPPIVELCRTYGARLMVDEAHGVGVLGARGAGACELFGLEDQVDLRMGTFSKSLASCGGFIAGPAEVVEYLRIASRSVHLQRLRRPGRRRRRAGALRIIRSEGPELFERCSTTPPTCDRASATSDSRWSSPGPSRTAARRPPRWSR